MKNVLIQSCAVALAIVVAGCAAPAKISSEMRMPAKSPDAARLRTIAVMPFESKGQQDVTPEIEALLASIQIEGRPYFTVVERSRLNEALKELRLGESGAIDAATAAKLGQMIAANGIYLGAVTRDDFTQQRYTENRRVCTEYTQVRDKKGNLVQGACANYVNQTVNCSRRSANFEFVPKLVSVSTGTIIYSRSISGAAEDSSCEDQNRPGEAAGDLRRQARAIAVGSFRADVAPYSQQVEITFMTSNEGIVAQPAKDRFEASMAFAREKRLDRACEMWTELLQVEKSSPSLTFNVGVCAEVAGNLAAALSLYSTADRQTSKPDKIIGEGLVRIRARQAAERKLQQASAGSAGNAPLTTSPAPQPLAVQGSGTAGSITQPTAAPMPTASVPAAPPTKDLIARAQAKLRTMGYDIGVPDGIPGPRSKAAVKKYQVDQKLPASGEFDMTTIQSLKLP